MSAEVGWNEYGHARMTGTAIDKYLGRGDLQDAEDCNYEPTSVLADLDIDPAYGDPRTQFRAGQISLRDGTILQRGGFLGCVWGVAYLPRGEA